MNTAAPNATYIHTHQSQNQARQDSYAADRISAQEAMKSMRISDPQQVTWFTCDQLTSFHFSLFIGTKRLL